MTQSNIHSEPAQSNKPITDILIEIEQIPEEYLPDLLQIVHLFRQSIEKKQTSVTAWTEAINEIKNSNPVKKQEKQQKIQQLLQSWNELEDEEEQRQTWQTIQQSITENQICI